MEVLLGLLQFISISIVCLLELIKRSPAVFLWATLFVMFGVMHFFSSIVGISEYSFMTLNKASIFVIFFCVLYVVTRFILLKGNIKQSYNIVFVDKLQKNKGQEKVFIFITVVIIKLAEYCFKAGGLLETSWEKMREVETNISYINGGQLLSILFYALAGILLYELLIKNYNIVFILIFLNIVNILIMRNRVEILPLLVSIIAVVLLKMKHINIQA